MAGMARHGSATAFSGFSVCQPALGAALQWLPAVGTPELDDMVNSFLPGPASIQDKRAHISMDFFEYSRQTGETFKFYAVSSDSFTPVTASPANSAFYDSGYASSFNHSPVVSEQGSWTQSPATFTSDVKTKSRSSTKKSSPSSSRQIDFASHPGMRILTKDGQDVTNSASRGCKTKEQRDHAHLMRIIKACDACKKKKIRCDPSHRKRTASQASASQAEQKPAKKTKKAEAPPPVAVVGAAPDFLVGDAFDAPETTLSLPTFEAGHPQGFEEFWNDFITFDQEPLPVAAQFDNFLFDSSTDSQNFFSLSPVSSATSPSQVFTPATSAVSRTSPSLSDGVVDVAGEVSLHDPAVPYLNPGVAHGTNYVDFNLYSPGPDVFDEDNVFQMVDLASQHRSPQEGRGIGTPNYFWRSPSGDVGVNGLASPTTTSTRGWSSNPDTTTATTTATTMTTSISRFLHSPGLGVHVQEQSAVGRSLATNGSPVQSPVSRAYAPGVSRDTAIAMSAGVIQCLVPQGSPSRPGRTTSTSHSPLASAVVSTVHRDATEPGGLALSVASSPLTATSCHRSPQSARHTASLAALEVVRDDGQGCAGTSIVSSQLQTPAGLVPASSAQLGVQHGSVVLSAVLATIFDPTLPTRRIPAGEDAKRDGTQPSSPTPFFQLAVFGLVSLLCVSALLQAHLGLQVNLVNILAFSSLSLARLAPQWCAAGPPSAVSSHAAASGTLPSPPAPSGFASRAKSKMQAVGRSLLGDLQSAVLQRAGNSSGVPRLASVRLLRL